MKTNTSKEFLKDCLSDSLIKLLNKKGLNNISIDEITDTAGVSRSTYYRSFNSKEEVLLYFYKSCYKEWKYNNKLRISDIRKKEEFLVFIGFIKEMKDINFLLYKRHLSEVLKDFIDEEVRLCVSNTKTEDEMSLRTAENDSKALPNKYNAIFYSGIYFSVINEWIKDEYKGDICTFIFDNIIS
ncbi:MAG: TetR/AcrR family transcriptional regulator [Lachnospiraceae bacterium]|nr:TetR/AcrR family transcriptional regulator [Lachnospiraceae bacterium]